MRKRNQIKLNDPAADIAYENEFKKIIDKARANMKIFDELPSIVRRAMTEEPTGSISARDVRRHIGKFPDELLARAVIENGRVAYRSFMELVEQENDDRARQRNARLVHHAAPEPEPAPKKARRRKKAP